MRSIVWSYKFMFKFKSVFFLSLGASPRKGATGKTAEFSIHSPDWVDRGTQFTKAKITVPRDSLPSQTVNLIKVNFDIGSADGVARMTELLKERLSSIELPCKIYIDAHCDLNSETLSQKYYSPAGPDYHVKLNRIPYAVFADIMQQAIPPEKQRNIVFHLLLCNGSCFTAKFYRSLIRSGFRNIFAVCYQGKLKTIYKLMPPHYKYLRITDFSTLERQNPATGAFTHHSDIPGPVLLEDNKIIFYFDSLKIKSQPYREFIAEHAVYLSSEMRKNFFAYILGDLLEDYRCFVPVLGDLFNRLGCSCQREKRFLNNFFMLESACKIVEQEFDSMTIIELMRFLKITLMTLKNIIALRADKDPDEASISYEEFIDRNEQLISSIHAINLSTLHIAEQADFILETFHSPRDYVLRVCLGHIPKV